MQCSAVQVQKMKVSKTEPSPGSSPSLIPKAMHHVDNMVRSFAPPPSPPSSRAQRHHGIAFCNLGPLVLHIRSRPLCSCLACLPCLPACQFARYMFALGVDMSIWTASFLLSFNRGQKHSALVGPRVPQNADYPVRATRHSQCKGNSPQ